MSEQPQEELETPAEAEQDEAQEENGEQAHEAQDNSF
jgi:hypothetical protein